MSIRTTTPIMLQKRLAERPTFEKPVVLPTPELGCGISDVEHNRIVGGVPAALNGWPWMALIGYEEAFGDVDFRCGGSLITDHKIKPICLPTSEPVRGSDFTGYNPFIAGWGRTEETGYEAKVLQELQVPILENAECSQLYKKIRKLFSKKQFNDAVLCAGFLEGGKDSCQGDSGGPLMLPYMIRKQFHYFQIGIVSYGVGCARAELPGVYTRVATFVDWIVGQIMAN
uniref:Acrosin n=1 Tax=Anopheles dirus TaxID=7168 RepID=A0A182NWN1_9DIPT